MQKNLYLSLLVAGLLLTGCKANEAEPDFSDLSQVPYSVQSMSATETQVAVYPNPFFDHVNVEVPAVAGEVVAVYFSDEKGKYSRKIELPEGTANRAVVNFSGMPEGIYTCEIVTQDKISTYRLIKAR
ncbi:T9SS type A sorting domain-containing protein [Pontibacter sp. H249]|uniref:T9SS type A sorting domain-containing protein n=1 Tax=Pontibacter sp. H249 TaxID=3133420 RepID=UPI0030C2CE79